MSSRLDSVFEGIYWHQRWEVEPGIFTPGRNPVAELMNWADVPLDLSGKRVLDIGAWNGCFSFECERRNAAEILAIGPEPSTMTGFDKLKTYLRSRVIYQQGTVYDLRPDVLGKFDVVICFGVIYHLRYPLLAFDMMRRVCACDLFVETAGIDHNLLIDGQSFALESIDPKLNRLSLLQFYRLGELNNDTTNWFSFNKKCLEDMLLSSGFEPLFIQEFHDRIAAHSQIIPGAPEWFTNSGEGVYYDIITRPIMGPPDVY
jgi:tRNA (mo5U34)-methyltransferase